MKAWTQITHYAALDWARDHHDIVVVDRSGTIVSDFRIQHSIEGWTELRSRLAPYPDLAVAVETNQGPAVEQMMSAGLQIYPVNPRSARNYRDRKAPTGVKNDRLDAWATADALRVDGHTWRPLKPEDPLIAELRQLCRDEVSMIEQRTSLLAQLRHTLHAYYPAALEAFEDWTFPSCWEFLIEFPTPEALAAAGPRKWKRWLATHNFHWQGPNEKRLAVFARATLLQGNPSTVAAKSLLAVSIAKILRTLEAQLREYRRQIQDRFEKHPDHDLFGSLPGAGPKMAPRLLSELGDDRSRFPSPDALQCYAGTAPISFQSGQINRTLMRRACNLELRQAVHLWASLSMRKSTWAYAYYLKHRRDGQSHSCALRCLGQRWLKIVWKMWQSRTRYDPDFHQRNQLKHGSWVLQLQAPTSP
jgi:transposase